MLYLQSHLFSKARKEAPADAEAVSHKLLLRAGYIDQLASGIFSFLPMGYLVQENIMNIIREEMQMLSAIQMHLPAMQPASLWQESGRLTTIDPPLFQFQDRHEKSLVLGSTHEEVITDLARKNIESYKDLPVAVYQIQTKFRNEVRATGGLLRVREFYMKDLYSFHTSTEDLQAFYEQVKKAYIAIFTRCGLKVHVVKADSGTIGGAVSHEFSSEAPTGEDKVAVCTSCGFAANIEVLKNDTSTCPECGGAFELRSCIENGHAFQLGTKYSEKMNALFTDETGNRKPLVMGCYGIGVGRLLATIIEAHHDDKGIIWPSSVAPFAVHVVSLQDSVKEHAKNVATELGKHTNILWDDRSASVGQKFSESDLLGIPRRVVISEKNKDADSLEVVYRESGETKQLSQTDLLKEISA